MTVHDEVHNLRDELQQVKQQIHTLIELMNVFLSDSTAQHLHHAVEEQNKKEQHMQRIRKFFDMLAEDETLNRDTDGNHSLSRLLYLDGVSGRLETFCMTRDSNDKMVEKHLVIDVAQLLNLLFREKGINSSSEELMDYVIAGGKVEDFLKDMTNKHKQC